MSPISHPTKTVLLTFSQPLLPPQSLLHVAMAIPDNLGFYNGSTPFLVPISASVSSYYKPQKLRLIISLISLQISRGGRLISAGSVSWTSKLAVLRSKHRCCIHTFLAFPQVIPLNASLAKTHPRAKFKAMRQGTISTSLVGRAAKSHGTKDVNI